MSVLFDVPVHGAYQLLINITGVLGPVPAILVCTVAVRLLLHPLARAAARGERTRSALAPRMRELQQKYGRDRERLQREISRLYRESGGSMFAGCLPTLAQLPFLFVMFRLFSSGTVAGEANGLLAHTVLGTPLGAHISVADPVFLLLVAGLLAVAWCASRLTPPNTPPPLRFLPYTSILGLVFLPLAGGIYLLTSNAWGVAERTYLRRTNLDKKRP